VKGFSLVDFEGLGSTQGRIFEIAVKLGSKIARRRACG